MKLNHFPLNIKITVILITLSYFSGSLLNIGNLVLAADTPGLEVTNTYTINDKDAKDGDIMANSKDGFVRANIPYEPGIFGILVKKPVIVYRDGDPNSVPIVRSGVAQVNVVATNGQIQKGDYITSSAAAGKGMKAAISGYVIGIALSSLTGKDGQIPVAVKIEYAEISNARTLSRVIDAFGGSLFTNIRDPGNLAQFFRYIAAGLVIIFAVAFAFFTFSRSIPKGIEAIGRNPMARTTIMLSLGMSITLTIVTIGLGIVAAIIILRV